MNGRMRGGGQQGPAGLALPRLALPRSRVAGRRLVAAPSRGPFPSLSLPSFLHQPLLSLPLALLPSALLCPALRCTGHHHSPR